GVFLAQRAHPAQGRMVEVAGGALHILDIGPRDAAGPPMVRLNGASSNLEVMRRPVGERLASKHRVILIDRPGHGWSTRLRLEDSTPEIQGRMIGEALAKLGVGQAIFVVHSWAGALGLRMALDEPQTVAGLVMLAPVAYPWPGGVGRYNKIIATPVIGPLLAYTITLPLGHLLAEGGSGGRMMVTGARGSIDPRFFSRSGGDGDAARGLMAPDGIRSLRAGFRCSSRQGMNLTSRDIGQPTFEGERHVRRHSSGQGQGRQGRRAHTQDQGRRDSRHQRGRGF